MRREIMVHGGRSGAGLQVPEKSMPQICPIFLLLCLILVIAGCFPRLIRDPWDSSAQARYYEVSRMTTNGRARQLFIQGCRAVEHNDYELAISSFQAALEHDSSFGEALFELGRAQRAAKNFDAAIEALEMAQMNVVDNQLVLKELNQTRTVAAEYYYTQALLSDSSGPAHSGLREKFLKRALEFAPGKTEVLFALGEHYQSIKKPLLALHYFRKVFESDETQPEVVLRLVETYLEIGDYDSARSVVLEAGQRFGPDESFDRMSTMIDQEMVRETGPVKSMNLEQEKSITRAQVAAIIVTLINPRHVKWKTLPQNERPLIALDIKGHWAEEYIREIMAYRIMRPFSNHTFKPDAFLHRYEFAAILVYFIEHVAPEILLSEQSSTMTLIRDVLAEHKFFNAIQIVVRLRIMTLNEQNEFLPFEYVSGLEAIEILHRLYELLGPESVLQSDLSSEGNME